METTEVPAEQSAAEIVACLVKAGASQIATDYDAGKIKGLRWLMVANGQPRMFGMPARVDPVYALLRKRAVHYVDAARAAKLRAQAERVAWRQLLRWVQAQLAMIDCGMMAAEEIFLPYLQTPAGVSLYEMFKGGGFPMLGPGNSAEGE